MARITVDSSPTRSTAVRIQEIWSARTIDEREKSLVFGKLCDRNYEAELKAGPGDTLHIPTVTHPNSANARTMTIGGSGTLTYDAPTETAVTLSINVHAYSAFEVDTETNVLSYINWVEKYAPFAGYNVALKIDKDVATQVASYTQTVGTLAVDVTDDNVLLAINFLDDASAPRPERYFVFSAKQKNQFFTQDKYVYGEYKEAIGSADPKAAPATKFSDVYGPDWYWTENTVGSNAAGHNSFLFQKEALALAIVSQYTKSMYWIDDDAEKHAVHAIYGDVIVRNNHGVWIKSL